MNVPALLTLSAATASMTIQASGKDLRSSLHTISFHTAAGLALQEAAADAGRLGKMRCFRRRSYGLSRRCPRRGSPHPEGRHFALDEATDAIASLVRRFLEHLDGRKE